MINYPPGMPQDQRVCFGVHWDANAAQCKGGLDPSIMSTDGTATHRRCDWFAKCAAETVKTNLSKKGMPYQAQAQVNVPVAPPMQSIMRGVAQGARQALVRHISQPTAPTVQPVHPNTVQPHYGQPAPVMVHPSQAAVPYMVSMNYQQPGMQMPGYLTVQEPSMEGQHWTVRLMLNIGRAMVKAGAHTTANFVDHTPVNQPVYCQPETPKEQS